MFNLLAILFVSLLEPLLEMTKQGQKSRAELPRTVCPSCGSERIVKNGSTPKGTPKNQCKDCGRQFVLHPTQRRISSETQQLIDKLLKERISLRGIARVTGVSWDWLQNYVNRKMSSIPRQVKVSRKTRGHLTVECDEMWSFVRSKNQALYVWLAIDRDTREIVGCFIGDRTRKSARQLWKSLPQEYQEIAIAYTDFWVSYKKVIPSHRHRAVGKETGKTNHIERLNNTFRQRVSRLVRKSLSFSKKLSNHIGAIWYFIHAYNEELASL